MLEVNQIYLGDCLEVMKGLDNSSVDAIITDPPYFKVKKDSWDRQWDKPKAFLEWLDKVAEEWERVLKPNGSLYCFTSPKMAARVEVMLAERFNVLNHIVWQKIGGTRANQACKDIFRGFFADSERIIFCEHYGADNHAKGEAGYVAKCDELRGFIFEPLREWFESEKIKAGLTNKQVNEALGTATNGSGMAGHYFKPLGKIQWDLPTKEHYNKLQIAFSGYFTRSYEELREQYEELKRPFQVSKDVPYTDVWTFPTVKPYKNKHPCEKPQDLLKHMITASTKEGAIILDCFAGTGSLCLAAINTNRNYIGIEKDENYFKIAQERVRNYIDQTI